MPAEAVQIAQALVADLNHEDRDWAVTFEAERRYMEPIERAQMGDAAHVHVFPLTLEQTRATRRGNERAYGLVVLVRQAVDPADPAQIDPLIELVQQIADRYPDIKRLESYDAAIIESVEPASPGGEIYDPNLLATDRVFVGGLIINFKLTE